MENLMQRFVLMLAALVLVYGCASAGRKIDQSKSSQIDKGKTTKQQVLDLVGSPDRITTISDGSETWTYSYAKATPTAATFIPVVGLLAGGAEVKTQTLVVTIGKDGIVKEVASSKGVTKTGLGANTGGGATMDELEENKRPL